MRLTAELTPCSKSTKVPSGHSTREISSRVRANWPVQVSVKEHEKDLERLGIQLDAHSLPAQFTRGGIRFKDSKAIALCRPKVASQVHHGFRSV